MRWRTIPIGLALLAGLLTQGSAAQSGLTITPDPAVYSVFAEAAATWTAAGVPVSVAPGGLPIVVVWWEPGGNLACHGDGVNCPAGAIYVDGYDPWSAAMAAHELGHALGLGYHRTDQLSCMSSPIYPTTPAGPDAHDLAALGVTVAGVATAMEAAVAVVSERAVTALPNTGTGGCAVSEQTIDQADAGIIDLFALIAEVAEAHGGVNIGALPGCWEFTVDDQWRIALNGHLTDMPEQTGVSVPPFHCYVEYNGWPAGLLSPFDGTLAAGVSGERGNLYCGVAVAIADHGGGVMVIATRPSADEQRPCWQCNGGGYVIPANKVSPRGGAPSLVKCGGLRRWRVAVGGGNGSVLGNGE